MRRTIRLPNTYILWAFPLANLIIHIHIDIHPSCRSWYPRKFVMCRPMNIDPKSIVISTIRSLSHSRDTLSFHPIMLFLLWYFWVFLRYWCGHDVLYLGPCNLPRHDFHKIISGCLCPCPLTTVSALCLMYVYWTISGCNSIVKLYVIITLCCALCVTNRKCT